MKILLIIIGSLSLVVGAIGIIVPGLPTTTFLLISAACYVRSSEKLYNWLLEHKIFGKFIRDYRINKGMPFKSKVIALLSMWSMMSISIFFFIDNTVIKIIVVICGLIGTAVILYVKTIKVSTEKI